MIGSYLDDIYKIRYVQIASLLTTISAPLALAETIRFERNKQKLAYLKNIQNSKPTFPPNNYMMNITPRMPLMQDTVFLSRG